MSTTLPYPPDRVRRRYDSLAPWYPIFEWVLWLPPGIRERAVRTLDLQPGGAVLEIGCGTGRNFGHLEAAVGPAGHVYGVDLSEEMLSRAKRLCAARAWRNVTLIHGDALLYTAPAPVDAVLFSLSYCTMLHRLRILEHAWSQLKPGGRLVILEARLVPSLVGRLSRPFLVALMKATVLGDPDHDTMKDVRSLTEDVTVTEELFGSYFICAGRKKVT